MRMMIKPSLLISWPFSPLRMPYTKMLVHALSDRSRRFDISNAMQTEYFDDDAEIVADKLAALIKKSVPDQLLGE